MTAPDRSHIGRGFWQRLPPSPSPGFYAWTHFSQRSLCRGEGLQILAVRGFRNRLKKFLQKSLMPVFLFFRIYRICKDFSCKKFVYEIRTRGNNVRFLPSAPHSETSVMCTTITLLDKLEV